MSGWNSYPWIFVTILENSSVVRNDTQGFSAGIIVGTFLCSLNTQTTQSWIEFFSAIMDLEQTLIFFLVYYQAIRSNQKAPTPLSSKWQFKLKEVKKG